MIVERLVQTHKFRKHPLNLRMYDVFWCSSILLPMIIPNVQQTTGQSFYLSCPPQVWELVVLRLKHAHSDVLEMTWGRVPPPVSSQVIHQFRHVVCCVPSHRNEYEKPKDATEHPVKHAEMHDVHPVLLLRYDRYARQLEEDAHGIRVGQPPIISSPFCRLARRVLPEV